MNSFSAVRATALALMLCLSAMSAQAAVSFYTVNARVADPRQAVAASRKASEMYKAIQQFLKSSESYLDLGE